VATPVIGTTGVFFTFPSHRFSPAPAIFPPSRFTFSRQAHAVDYRRALSLTDMPPKLLKSTTTSKKPMFMSQTQKAKSTWREIIQHSVYLFHVYFENIRLQQESGVDLSREFDHELQMYQTDVKK
jgi:hypothetical protein